MNYSEFFKEKRQIDNVAVAYGQLYLKLRGWDKQRYYVDSDKIEYSDDSISVGWLWYGAYQSEDQGWINIPVDVLETPNLWESHIQNEINAEKERQEKLDAENNERVRQYRIKEAKAILEKEGLL